MAVTVDFKKAFFQVRVGPEERNALIFYCLIDGGFSYRTIVNITCSHSSVWRDLARICNIKGNVYFRTELNQCRRLSVCTLRANYKKVQAALNICEPNIRTYLQILVRLVRHLKQLVSLRLKRKWIIQMRLEQPQVVCRCFFFFYIKQN